MLYLLGLIYFDNYAEKVLTIYFILIKKLIFAISSILLNKKKIYIYIGICNFFYSFKKCIFAIFAILLKKILYIWYKNELYFLAVERNVVTVWAFLARFKLIVTFKRIFFAGDLNSTAGHWCVSKRLSFKRRNKCLEILHFFINPLFLLRYLKKTLR